MRTAATDRQSRTLYVWESELWPAARALRDCGCRCVPSLVTHHVLAVDNKKHRPAATEATAVDPSGPCTCLAVI